MYFAFYRPRFSSVETLVPSESPRMATIQEHKPAGPFGKPSFEIDEAGVVRGTDQTGKPDSGKRFGFPPQRSSSSPSKPASPAIDTAQSTPEQGGAAVSERQRTDQGTDVPNREPGLATKVGETSENERSGASDTDTMKSPAQNNGGNNLMRALKEAGQRKQQNISTSSDSPTKGNPFDSILKSRRADTDKEAEE